MATFDTIEAAFVRQFADTYTILAGQQESRLYPTVSHEGDVVGYSFTTNEMGELGESTEPARMGATQYADAEVASRLAIMNNFSNFTRLDVRDRNKLKADPQSEQIKRLIRKRNKKVDSVIFNALIGPAQRKTVSEDTYTPVQLPASQVVGDGTSPLTKAQLIAIRNKFLENDVEEKLYILFNAEMASAILADETLTSADYMASKFLQDGSIGGTWLGFEWIHYEALPKEADTGITTGVAYSEEAVRFGEQTISPLKIVEDETHNRMLSIGLIEAHGAVRQDEKRVVKFLVKAA